MSNLFDKQKLRDLYFENTNDGIVVCSDEWDVLFCNEIARDFLNIESYSDLSLKGILNEDELNLLQLEKKLIKNDILFTIHLFGKHCYLTLNDKKKELLNNEKLEKCRQMNHELQFMLEQYSDDTIYITDHHGNTLYAGEGVAQNCGVKSSDLIGKNVENLQKEGVFNPSVTLKVLESKQPEVVIQNTYADRKVISFGTPIFNSKNELTKVVSISRDITKQINNSMLLSQLDQDTKDTHESYGFYPNFITCSPKLQDVIELVQIVAKVNSTVLIYGETGTGKDVLARIIHNQSNRSSNPFIKLNCGAIAPNLIESELYGYEGGAFTGANKNGKIGLVEAANGGTLFLDEVSELPLNQQVKLLQVLQERKMTRVGGIKSIDLDVRFIAASNRYLKKMVDENKFREDLFYRLNILPITIPPLKDRTEDIPLLVKHFLKIFNANYNENKTISKACLELLSAYNWPGNVRELEHIVERLVITTKNSNIDVASLPENIAALPVSSMEGLNISVKNIVPLNEALEEVEKQLIKMAIKKLGTTQKIAEVLQVNQSTISRKIQRYNLLEKRK